MCGPYFSSIVHPRSQSSRPSTFDLKLSQSAIKHLLGSLSTNRDVKFTKAALLYSYFSNFSSEASYKLNLRIFSGLFSSKFISSS